MNRCETVGESLSGEDTGALAEPTVKRPVFSVGLWVMMFIIFVESPALQINDSLYSMLTAESLIHNYSPDLSRYSIPDFEADLPFSTVRGHHAYQLMRTRGRLLYGYPHGTSFLSMPLVGLMDLFGVSAATPDKKFDRRGEIEIQKLLAAIVSAFVVIVFFWTARLVLDLRWSAVVAVGAGLGTQIWSTASRGMWSHTWEIMLGALVVQVLLAGEIRSGAIRPVRLANLVSWMFFVRPSGAITVICVSGYLLARHRSRLVPFLAVGMVWLVAFAAYSLRIFGTLVPPYYLSNDPRSLGVHVGTALYGILISPSRGILLFCPVIAWVSYLLFRFWRDLPYRPLAILSLCAVGGVVIANLINAEWWGGACYGPRLLTDALPWLVLLAILGIAAVPPELRTLRRPLVAIGALLLLVSVAINGYGACSPATMRWNFSGPSPDIMLDWSRPQLPAGWIRR